MTYTNTITPNGYLRFDRHDLYNTEESARTFFHSVRMLIKAIHDAEERADCLYSGLRNRVDGLYDGYLYDNLIIDIATLGASPNVMVHVSSVVNEIARWLHYNGEATTRI